MYAENRRLGQPFDEPIAGAITKNGEIQQEVGVLVSNVENLSAIVSDLESRLYPCLIQRPEKEGMSEENVKDIRYSPFAGTLYDMNGRLRQITAQLLRIQKNLAI